MKRTRSSQKKKVPQKKKTVTPIMRDCSMEADTFATKMLMVTAMVPYSHTSSVPVGKSQRLIVRFTTSPMATASYTAFAMYTRKRFTEKSRCSMPCRCSWGNL